MHSFYHPNIDPNATYLELEEEESKHCVRVLRLRKGSRVLVFDGIGGEFLATISMDNPKKVILEINTYTNKKRKSSYLHIAIAPPKNIERLEWFLEKSTEIGLDEISLIVCEHSERKEARIDRLQKVLISALKQSHCLYLPKLNEPKKVKDLINHAQEELRLIAHCEAGERVLMKDVMSEGLKTLVLIGPEGDFSGEEISWALEHQFQGISLGENRLRTETAGIMVCAEHQVLTR